MEVEKRSGEFPVARCQQDAVEMVLDIQALETEHRKSILQIKVTHLERTSQMSYIMINFPAV